jgi:hypothetical protein
VNSQAGRRPALKQIFSAGKLPGQPCAGSLVKREEISGHNSGRLGSRGTAARGFSIAQWLAANEPADLPSAAEIIMRRWSRIFLVGKDLLAFWPAAGNTASSFMPAQDTTVLLLKLWSWVETNKNRLMAAVAVVAAGVLAVSYFFYETGQKEIVTVCSL